MAAPRGGMPNLPPSYFKGGARTARVDQPISPEVQQRGKKSPNQTKTGIVNPLAPSGSSAGKRQPDQTKMGISKPISEGNSNGKRQPKLGAIPRGKGGMSSDKPTKKNTTSAKGDSPTGMAAAGAPYLQPRATKAKGYRQTTSHM